MPGEFKNLLKEFVAIGPTYCKNVRKVLEDAEMKKVVDIYEAGFTASLSGSAALFSSYFDELPPSQQQEVDRLIGASGGLELLRAANTTMQQNYLGNPAALGQIPIIIEIIKKIIENFLSFLPGWALKLLEKIDLILDGLHGVLPQPPKPQTGAPHTVSPLRKETLQVGKDKTIPMGGKVTDVQSSDPKIVGVASGTGAPENVTVHGVHAGGPVTVRVTLADGTTRDLEVTVTP